MRVNGKFALRYHLLTVDLLIPPRYAATLLTEVKYLGTAHLQEPRVIAEPLIIPRARPQYRLHASARHSNTHSDILDS